ncbi:MAG: ceramide glucosyltransferase [Xanthobacteraceae bacterium]|jgi:ceramide glucosyltransferase
MTAPILAAATFCIATIAIHIASVVIAALRLRRRTPGEPASRQNLPAVSLVRPLCGIDNHAADTLSSTFALDYPRCEILFCVASAKDPVVALIEAMMAEHVGAGAKLLIGDERVSPNPKLNNVLKGWRAASHDWIVLADANVLMPHDYIERLFAGWREDTGLVASPPIGAQPEGFWAELECAFLNTYQARWQYIADAFGLGFAQGKTMLWRRADLERAGGIEALAKEVAEDAASTKIVRGAGLKVRLVDRPFAQPLGYRSAAEVWNRQLRWARLRRASFFVYFLPEALSGGVLPMLALAVAAPAFALPPALSVVFLGLFWYGAETLLAVTAGWHVSARYPLHCLARDLLLPVLFVSALRGDDFVWRGNEMQVERVRPRLTEFVPVARRRLRSLRERMS